MQRFLYRLLAEEAEEAFLGDETGEGEEGGGEEGGEGEEEGGEGESEVPYEASIVMLLTMALLIGAILRTLK